jgi:hypothetical protein
MVEYRPMSANLMRRARRAKLTFLEWSDVFDLHEGALHDLKRITNSPLSAGCFFYFSR